MLLTFLVDCSLVDVASVQEDVKNMEAGGGGDALGGVKIAYCKTASQTVVVVWTDPKDWRDWVVKAGKA